MAWLLQEPRLVANIPVFSVTAIKPLIASTTCHQFVSEGAVQLTIYILSRLEPVLEQVSVNTNDDISDDEDDYCEESFSEGSTLIWKVCSCDKMYVFLPRWLMEFS
jgi:hypothetical protein